MTLMALMAVVRRPTGRALTSWRRATATAVGAAGASAGAFGLFASVTLPCGAVLGNYTGLVKPQARPNLLGTIFWSLLGTF